jgi:hypothetical protein
MCPYTLHHNKMLASTMQHSTNNHTPPPTSPPPKPTSGVRQPTAGAAQKTHPTQDVLSGPNSAPNSDSKEPLVCHSSTQPPPTTTPPTRGQQRQPCTGVNLYVKGEPNTPQRNARPPHHSVRLLRKEVIQPHLPVRLPCYDFVLIASPTFDHSPPYGLGHGLRVLPTFMT